jgi:aminopeptidase-like protein
MDEIGIKMYSFIKSLYPICRSITGDGLRESLRLVKTQIPLELLEVPTGTKVFDWEVPREWNIRDAYIKNSAGQRILDFHKSNLHVLNYSTPINQVMRLTELKEHLSSIPEYPDWIPYRTSYYKDYWGFCLSHNSLMELKDEKYEVLIDSSLEEGHLSYGEYFIQGATVDEVLISTHCCHPSLCNDNLSGIALTTFLAKLLSTKSLRYSYRFLFIPGTIGSITWLQLNENKVKNINHGLVVACVGDPGKPVYKKSRRGNSEIDKVVEYILAHSGKEYEIQEFSPYGYDERQYCSPGFNLPVGSLTRTPHGRFPEYHTSADNLDFIQPEYLADSLKIYIDVIEMLERNQKYLNTNLKCEPQLGKRGLYSFLGGLKDSDRYELAMLWVLNFSDGQSNLLDIAEKSGMEFNLIYEVANILVEKGLLIRA